MRPLFSDAPVMQQAQTMPAQPVGSQLAAALSRPTGMPNYGNPAPQIPLETMMKLMKGSQDQGTGSTVTSQTPNLPWNPDNAVGTDTLSSATSNQGNPVSNYVASMFQQTPPQPPVQGQLPGPLGMMGQIYGGGASGG